MMSPRRLLNTLLIIKATFVGLSHGQSVAFILGGLYQSGYYDRAEVRERVSNCEFTEGLHLWADGEFFGCPQERN